MKRFFTVALQVLAILSVFIGLGIILLPKGFGIAVGVVIICLSLAFGIITCNMVSILVLLIGIAVITVNRWVIGAIFIALGIAGVIIAIVLLVKMKKASQFKVICHSDDYLEMKL